MAQDAGGRAAMLVVGQLESLSELGAVVIENGSFLDAVMLLAAKLSGVDVVGKPGKAFSLVHPVPVRRSVDAPILRLNGFAVGPKEDLHRTS